MDDLIGPQEAEATGPQETPGSGTAGAGPELPERPGTSASGGLPPMVAASGPADPAAAPLPTQPEPEQVVAPPTIALKVDVDTYHGLREGVPRLMGILERLGVTATFCVAMGPDNSGKAIRRIFRPGFVGKMLRTRAVSMYGSRTLLYGTLLRAPLIGAGAPQLLRELETAGHEVIPHGWDHVAWHDYLTRWDFERTRAELTRACEALAEAVGHPCQAVAAPGWQATETSVRAQQELGLRYAADTRGWCPFYPLVEGEPATVLQLPTTLPTLDEAIGLPELASLDLLDHYLWMCRRMPAPTGLSGLPQTGTPVHVLTVHAEVEGRGWARWFQELVACLLAEGARVVTLAELASTVIARGNVPAGRIIQSTVPGRAGRVSCQDTVG